MPSISLLSGTRAGRLGIATLLVACFQLTTAAAHESAPHAPMMGGLDHLATVTHVIATGRLISPIGLLMGTPNFATAVAVDGRDAYVLANGATKSQSITRYDTYSLKRLDQVRGFRKDVPGKDAAEDDTTGKGILSNIAHQNFFQGLAVGAKKTVFAAGGSSDVLLALRPGKKGLEPLRRYHLAFYPFPKNQYPYRYQGSRGGHYHFYPDGVTIDQAGTHAYVTGLLSNAVARIDLQTGAVQYANAGPYPYAPVLTDHDRRLIVSDWGGCGVRVLDSHTLKPLGQVCIGPATGPNNADPGIHPTALAAIAGTSRVVFTASNIDKVVEIDARSLKVVHIFDDAPYPHAPPGSYPNALAVHDGRVYVANAGNNDIAVFDLKSGRRLGLIPTAWYPTGLAATRDALYIVAAKGMGSGPNQQHQWGGTMMHGVLQRISYAQIERNLPRLTATAMADDGFDTARRKVLARDNAKTTRYLHRHIRTVVFILRENKTFDEELGKLPGIGHWADPKLALYSLRELPNLFAWAKGNALFTNFYADGEVTAQGHQWVTGASDSDFVQRTWPQYYSGRGMVPAPGWTQSLVPASLTDGTGGISGGVANPYSDYTDLSKLGKWSNPWISYPERLYLFDNMLAHRVGFEDFGEFVSRTEAGAISPAMRAHIALNFPAWDRMILDTHRAKIAIDWMRKHANKMPRFIYIWLPDDHTAGNDPCYYTPDYYVANSDSATARIVHYLSTTPQWKHMLVFLTEDDTQSGADHIDAHRTFAVALGPWVKRGLVTTRYSQVNIVRTIEATLDLPPMSQWDGNASVIRGIWRKYPDNAVVPVQAQKVGLEYNKGKCPEGKLLRRIAGKNGDTVTASWLHKHLHQSPPSHSDGKHFTPTSLLTVSGAEQMRQEWIASKGKVSFERTMRYIRRMAREHHAPVSQYLASDSEEGDDD